MRIDLNLQQEKYPIMSVVEISNQEFVIEMSDLFSDPDYPDINEFIFGEVAHENFTELSELNYKGMVIYSVM